MIGFAAYARVVRGRHGVARGEDGNATWCSYGLGSDSRQMEVGRALSSDSVAAEEVEATSVRRTLPEQGRRALHRPRVRPTRRHARQALSDARWALDGCADVEGSGSPSSGWAARCPRTLAPMAAETTRVTVALPTDEQAEARGDVMDGRTMDTILTNMRTTVEPTTHAETRSD